MSEFMPEITGVVLIFAVLAALAYWEYVATKEEQSRIEEEKAIIERCACKVTGGTLFVEQQIWWYSKVLGMQRAVIKQYRDNPVNVHIGSATVGGVTTGGVYTTGGGTTTTVRKSDRYLLTCKQIEDGKITTKPVVRIRLSDDLLKKAKNSKIEPYLDGNEIIVAQYVPHSETTMMLMRGGAYTAAMNRRNEEEVAGYPTREKCENIIAWLSGE